MRPYVLCAVLVVAALFVARPTRADDEKKSDDEKYTVKSTGFLAKGKSVKVNEKASIVSAVKVTDDNNNVLMDKKDTKSMLRVFVEKTLDADEKANKRTKYTRTYEKAKDVTGDESENKPYHNRTIVFEKSEGKWKLSAEGKPELGDSDLKELADETNKESAKDDKFFYPKDPVKVGEKWKLPAKDVAKFLDEFKMDPDSVKAEGKLLKAYKKGKQQRGVIEYVVTFECDLGEIKKIKGEMKMTIDQALDGSDQTGKAGFTVTLTANQTLEQNCKKFTLDLNVKAVFSVDRAEAK